MIDSCEPMHIPENLTSIEMTQAFYNCMKIEQEENMEFLDTVNEKYQSLYNLGVALCNLLKYMPHETADALKIGWPREESENAKHVYMFIRLNSINLSALIGLDESNEGQFLRFFGIKLPADLIKQSGSQLLLDYFKEKNFSVLTMPDDPFLFIAHSPDNTDPDLILELAKKLSQLQ